LTHRHSNQVSTTSGCGHDRFPTTSVTPNQDGPHKTLTFGRIVTLSIPKV
jgi:hypothetical protein